MCFSTNHCSRYSGWTYNNYTFREAMENAWEANFLKMSMVNSNAVHSLVKQRNLRLLQKLEGQISPLSGLRRTGVPPPPPQTSGRYRSTKMGGKCWANAGRTAPCSRRAWGWTDPLYVSKKLFSVACFSLGPFAHNVTVLQQTSLILRA